MAVTTYNGSDRGLFTVWLIDAWAYRPIGSYRRSKHRKLMTFLKLAADKPLLQVTFSLSLTLLTVTLKPSSAVRHVRSSRHNLIRQARLPLLCFSCLQLDSTVIECGTSSTFKSQPCKTFVFSRTFLDTALPRRHRFWSYGLIKRSINVIIIILLLRDSNMPHVWAATENVLIGSMMNTVRRCCGVFRESGAAV